MKPLRTFLAAHWAVFCAILFMFLFAAVFALNAKMNRDAFLQMATKDAQALQQTTDESREISKTLAEISKRLEPVPPESPAK